MNSKKPAAGWYDDPSQPKTRRFWDGETWTDQRQEAPPTEPIAPWKVIASILVALVIPILGLIIGIAMLWRSRTAAIWVIAVSVIAGLIWFSRLA